MEREDGRQRDWRRTAQLSTSATLVEVGRGPTMAWQSGVEKTLHVLRSPSGRLVSDSSRPVGRWKRTSHISVELGLGQRISAFGIVTTYMTETLIHFFGRHGAKTPLMTSRKGMPSQQPETSESAMLRLPYAFE